MDAPVLHRFFESIKTFSFWQRLFGWHALRAMAFDAYREHAEMRELLKSVTMSADTSRKEAEMAGQKLQSVLQQLDMVRSSGARAEERCLHFEKEFQRLQRENAELSRRVQTVEQNETMRLREHDARMNQALTLQASCERREREMQAEVERKQEERMARIRETWKVHEESVKGKLKTICERNAIEYVSEAAVIRGKPDNVVRICDELVVLDAKSPASDDLTNFNTYLKNQVESSSKYMTDESVRKEIFLVIPFSTVHVVKNFIYKQGTHTVYIVTPDVLEPLLLTMKRVEEYEITEQMTPEERRSICRVLGAFVHASKRRIQIDQFLNEDLLKIITMARQEIPEAIQAEVSDHERATKINPPADRRTKEIMADELTRRHAMLSGKTSLFEIAPAQELAVRSA